MKLPKPIQITSSEIRFYRIFFVMSGIAIPIFWYAYKLILPNAVDPISLRLGVGAIAITFFLISLLPSGKNYIKTLEYIFNYFASAWLIYLMYVNNAHPLYVFAFIIWFLIMSTFLKEMIPLIIFNTVVPIVSLIMILTLRGPMIDKLIYSSMLPMAVIVNFLGLKNRIDLERKLADSENTLRTVFEESADALFLSEAATQKLLDCNTKALEMFEIKAKGEIVGTPSEKIITEALTPEELKGGIEELNRTGHWEMISLFTTTKGKKFWGQMIVKRITIADKPVSLVRISDITNLKENELRLQEKSKQLEELNNVMVGREIEMKNLKEQLREFSQK